MMDLNKKFQGIRTPFYYYDMELLQRTLEAVKKANNYGYHIHYAIKANLNTPILTAIKGAGFGVDCVSGNEVKLALDFGFHPKHIVLAGVGKSDDEINYALEKDLFSFNVESIQELQVIDELAAAKAQMANVSIRINPELDEVGTHQYITTGAKGNKFGISFEDFTQSVGLIKSLKHINFLGLHFHIGSQILDLARFKHLADRVNVLQAKLKEQGFDIPHLNVGGGLGIDYVNPVENPIPDFISYFKTFNDHLAVFPGQQVHFELGRSIVGQCGHLVTRVLYTKESGGTHFAIVDAGMTELMRPALYQAHHHLENISAQGDVVTYDVVGPICESSDWLSKSVALPETKRGDLIVVYSAGAYGETMRNNYNGREFPQAHYSDELTN